MKASTLQTRRREGRTRLSADQRRDHLLDVAAKIVSTDGLHALTMDRLSERAGVSKGLGYVYFTNAEDVAVAIYDREVAEVYRRIMDATAEAGSLEVKVRRAVGAYLDVLAERGTVLAVLQGAIGAYWAKGMGRRRAGGFVLFWANLVGSELALPKAQAIHLAAMALGAADASVRTVSTLRLDRAAAEIVCARFVTAGLLGAIAESRPSTD